MMSLSVWLIGSNYRALWLVFGCCKFSEKVLHMAWSHLVAAIGTLVKKSTVQQQNCV